MRRILFAVLVLVLAFQATAFAAGPQKYAVVSMAKLIKDSEVGQDAQKKMAKKFETAKSQLQAKQKELESLKQSLQKQSLVLSLEAKQDKELEFKRKVRDYQDLAQATQRKMQMEEQKLGAPVLELIKKVVTEFGKKNGYAALFDKGAGGFLYVDDAIDVTNEVLLEMNRQFRAGKK
ncbi:OmpH family outer membrane protein [Maridesulfovibrio sp.]|uniref:OmpH family outer membrane protein n=1 Tax=Maridesulfovibrio sp. TaxID=2795000 RepID=UPI002A18C703|nr:OmpH family outer membrane protein [Maridesulfovibrio sp.]